MTDNDWGVTLNVLPGDATDFAVYADWLTEREASAADVAIVRLLAAFWQWAKTEGKAPWYVRPYMWCWVADDATPIHLDAILQSLAEPPTASRLHGVLFRMMIEPRNTERVSVCASEREAWLRLLDAWVSLRLQRAYQIFNMLETALEIPKEVREMRDARGAL